MSHFIKWRLQIGRNRRHLRYFRCPALLQERADGTHGHAAAQDDDVLSRFNLCDEFVELSPSLGHGRSWIRNAFTLPALKDTGKLAALGDPRCRIAGKAVPE
jgi:hypothetical protein